MSARNRELVGLIPASLLVTAGFAGVFIQRSNALSNVSLTYGAIFLGLCVAGHVFIRMTLPNADPYMFPLVALLASFGIVMIYRINPTLARQQAQWFVLGLVLFAVTIVAFRDYRKLEQYRYIIVVVSLGLLILPRLPGIGYQANGAYLGVRIPGLFVFQPAEFAKIGLVIFLASYLRDTRQVMVTGRAAVPRRDDPADQALRAGAVIWGLAMLIMLVLRDIGSSLMFYGGLLAMLYVATEQAVVRGRRPARVRDRRLVHGHAHPARPRPRRGVAAPARPAALQQGRRQLPARQLDVRPGRRRAVRPGLRRGDAERSRAAAPLLPAPQTDMIYAVITDELGLFGACAVLLTYLLFVARGFKTALLARDSFSTLLAVGLSAMFALQVFVIVGGVTRVIPLTGVTLPFISYGGSSIVANFVLLALLLLVSDRARRRSDERPDRTSVRRDRAAVRAAGRVDLALDGVRGQLARTTTRSNAAR